MVELKYSAPKICELSESELRIRVSVLILKINVITGWVLPSNEAVLTVLQDQFYKKLIEDYGGLNTDEIEYAFRQTGTTTIDWGKPFNLSLIDEVLIPYVNKRFQLSKKEEQKVPPPPQRIYTDEEILNQRRAEIELAFQAMKKGRLPIIHKYFSEVLKADGLIEEESEMSAFLSFRINSNSEHIYEKQ
ncbi:MAG TPA: hypothetical protein VIQ00_02675 [Chitinophagaceae bacterium]